jgi:hypothetical protein
MNVEAAPANAGLLRYFVKRAKHYHYTAMTDPKGTHPDLVMRLWDELGKLLPEDCHAVVHGAPVLVRPSTAIIFAFAGGTHTYAFRLPSDIRQAAMKAGATRVYHYKAYPQLKIDASRFDLAEVGDEWVFGDWLKGEDDWIKAAYDFAGT